jgi:hypothetical protein
LDDDYAWGGGNLHGLYNPENSALDVVLDFFTFCKLALKRNILAPNWHWPNFLMVAKDHLQFAFEKSDAQEKYGSAMSLRALGETVYGSSMMYGGQEDAVHTEIDEIVSDRCRKAFIMQQYGELKGADVALFQDAGGFDPWLSLLQTLRAKGVGRSMSDADEFDESSSVDDTGEETSHASLLLGVYLMMKVEREGLLVDKCVEYDDVAWLGPHSALLKPTCKSYSTNSHTLTHTYTHCTHHYIRY